MSTGMAARVAAVCAALAGLHVAYAGERRTVAVVSLSDDPLATKVAKALYEQLQLHWALRALGDFTLAAALEGPLVPDDGEDKHLETAIDGIARAEDFLTQFDYKHASDEAIHARDELTWVTPSTAIPLFANAMLLYGQALLGQGKIAEAQQAFGLVHRLDPMRRLDPGRYLPEIVDAYNHSTPSTDGHKLEIIGKGKVWIDGLDRGTAPGAFDVGYGWHVVQITGIDRYTRGEAVTPDAASVEIPDHAASKALQVQRARILLARAPDPAARAGAMRALAQLLEIHDAVLIDKRGDELDIQTWRDRAPGFSELHVYRDQKPIDLLLPLAPAKAPEPPEVHFPFGPPRPVDTTPWYHKRWVQASAVSLVVVGIVSALVYATRDQYLSVPDTGIPVGAAPGQSAR